MTQLEHQTAKRRARLAVRLRTQRSATPQQPGIPRRDPGDEPQLSFGQQRLWFLDQLAPGNPAYNNLASIRLSGPLDIAALQRGLAEIAQRHEALRTIFPAVDGEPALVILPQIELALPIVDLRAAPEHEREAQAQAEALAECSRPFDLEHGPLFRAALLRLADTEHVLLVGMHHIVSDGWSVGVLVRELLALYTAFHEQRPAPLPELPIQYADFAAWQRRYLLGDGERESPFQAQLGYWKQQLGNAAHILELPTDRPRPAMQTFNGGMEAHVIAKPLSEQIKALGRQEGCTLFMTLLAGFKALLYRHSGQADLSIGTPIANRGRVELEGLIGFFANTLVLRTELSGARGFRDVLAQVRRTALGAYAHQDLPFEKLVEELRPERDLSRNPLFQVTFVLQNAHIPPQELPGLALSPFVLDRRTVNFDLAFVAWDAPEGLRIFAEYNTDLFDAGTIRRMLGHFEQLLAGAVAEPDLPLARLPLLTAAERRQILAGWNATRADYPTGVSLHQLFERQVERSPRAGALVFEGQELTYAELNARANQLAHELRARGVGPEVLVGVCLERSIELVVALLGILKAGGAYVPIDPSYPEDRIAYMLADSRPAVLITTTDDRRPTTEDRGLKIEDSISRSTGELSSILHPLFSSESVVGGPWSVVDLAHEWQLIARQPQTNPAVGVNADNLAYMIYTSGSTGRPKGAMNTHGAIVNRLIWMQETYGLSADDRVLQKTPFSFDVSVWEFFWPLLFGARLVVARPEGHKDSAYLVRLIAEQGITTLHFVPSMLQVFLEAPGLEACASLRRVICSGEALPFDIQQRFFARLGAELHNLYGPTEAAVDVTFWACERAPGRTSVPIGRPVANTQIYLLDRQMQPVPIGLPGELYIGGVQLARGYHGRPDLTADRFIPNPFFYEDRGWRMEDSHPESSEMHSCSPENGVLKIKDNSVDTDHERSSIFYPPSSTRLYKTGDLARYQPDGAIEYLGRIDHQVKLRGFRIELGEIEAVLAQHPSVREAVVVAREDVPGDPRLVAYLTTTTDDRRPTTEDRGLKIEDSSAEASRELSSILYPPSSTESVVGGQWSVVGELRTFLKQRLPDYMVPSAFVVLEALPLSPNGKLDRRALPRPDQARPDLADTFVAPRDPLELRLAQIWEEVLNIRPIGVTDNFFDLGGHSLLAVRLMTQIQKVFDRELALATLFRGPTIEQLAGILRQQPDAAPWSPLVPIQARGTRPPLFFAHPVGGNVLCYMDLSRALGQDQPFYGLQSPGLDGAQEPFPSVEAMAACYVEAIRAMQPSGPYLLGGWCFGGAVAYEMARQLTAQGQEVRKLMMIDTYAPVPGGASPDIDYAMLVSWFTRDMAVQYGKQLLVTPEELRGRSQEEQLSYVLARMQAANIMAPDSGPEDLRPYLHVYTSNAQAMQRYVPGAYDSQVTLFRASEFAHDREPTLGWSAYPIGPLAIHDVPGNHNSMIFAPHARSLAEALSVALEAPPVERVAIRQAGRAVPPAGTASQSKRKETGMSQERTSRGFLIFALIWAGQLLSLLGSALTRFALGVWVYQETGSSTHLGIISLLGMLPIVLLSPIAGTLVDRWDRRKTMILSDIGAGLSTLAIALLFLSGQIAIWHIYIAVAISAAFSAFFWPAYTASMTMLVPKEHLGRANGMMQLAQAAEYIISPVLGAVLLAGVGLSGILLIDAVTFSLAMLALLFVRIPNPVASEQAAAAGNSLWQDVAYGWNYLLARPGLLGLMVLWGAGGLLLGIVSVLVTPLVLAFASPATLGTVMSVGGVGMLVGSVLMSTWGGPKRRIYGVFGFMLLEGLSILLGGLQPSAILFGVAVFGFFFGFPIVNGCTQAILQSKVAPAVQGRVMAMSNMIAWASLPLGYLAAGPLADRVFEPLLAVDGPLAGSIGAVIGAGPGRGIGLLFIVAGMLYTLIAAVGYLYPRLRLVELELADAVADTPPIQADQPAANQQDPAYAAVS